jgi:hypothetical protein
MARPANTVRPATLHLHIPEDLKTRLDLFLWSALEVRVPHGAYTRFLIPLIREFFDWRALDLHPYGFPEGYFVKGPKEMIEILEQTLKGEQP